MYLLNGNYETFFSITKMKLNKKSKKINNKELELRGKETNRFEFFLFLIFFFHFIFHSFVLVENLYVGYDFSFMFWKSRKNK